MPHLYLRAPEGSSLQERSQAAVLRACRHLQGGRGLESACPAAKPSALADTLGASRGRGAARGGRSQSPARQAVRSACDAHLLILVLPHAFTHSSPCFRHRKRGPLCADPFWEGALVTLWLWPSQEHPLAGQEQTHPDGSALRASGHSTRQVSEALGLFKHRKTRLKNIPCAFLPVTKLYVQKKRKRSLHSVLRVYFPEPSPEIPAEKRQQWRPGACSRRPLSWGQAPGRSGRAEHRALTRVRKGTPASSRVTHGAKMAREGDDNCFRVKTSDPQIWDTEHRPESCAF